MNSYDHQMGRSDQSGRNTGHQNRIELSSDGVRDQLTGALAPARFIELLKAELGMANRESRRITVISIRLAEKSSMTDPTPLAIEEYENQLILFAASTATLLRAGDYCGRVSESGFWILLRGDQRSSAIATQRLLAPHDHLTWKIEMCESEQDEEIKNLLRRIDALHFAK